MGFQLISMLNTIAKGLEQHLCLHNAHLGVNEDMLILERPTSIQKSKLKDGEKSLMQFIKEMVVSFYNYFMLEETPIQKLMEVYNPGALLPSLSEMFCQL